MGASARIRHAARELVPIIIAGWLRRLLMTLEDTRQERMEARMMKCMRGGLRGCASGRSAGPTHSTRLGRRVTCKLHHDQNTVGI